MEWDGKHLVMKAPFSIEDAQKVVSEGKGDPEDAPLVDRVRGAMNEAFSTYMVAHMERTYPTKKKVVDDFASILKLSSAANIQESVSPRVLDRFVIPRVCDWLSQEIASGNIEIPSGYFLQTYARDILGESKHWEAIQRHLKDNPLTEAELRSFSEGRGNEGNPELDAAVLHFCRDVWVGVMKRSLKFSKAAPNTVNEGKAGGPLIRVLQIFLKPIAPEKSGDAIAAIVAKMMKSKIQII